MTKSAAKLDLSELSREKRARIALITNPRDTMIARRFNGENIENWKAAAEREGISLTEWMECALNAACKKR